MNFYDDNGKNQRVVTLGAAELGMAGILFTFGGIFILLSLFTVKIPDMLNPIPTIGFFMSFGWILVSWKLIQSADKATDIRERRRMALYWVCYSSLITLFNAGTIIMFVTMLIQKKYPKYSDTFITAIVLATGVLFVRGFIFVKVLIIYSKELVLKSNPEIKNQRHAQNNHDTRESSNNQPAVIVTPV